MAAPLYLAVETVNSEPITMCFCARNFTCRFGCSYSPEHLVRENVILVTCNYRLSVLGFLYLPEAGIYGNAALKDQVSVLSIQKDTFDSLKCITF